jgi:hypothetical protein
MTQRALMFSTTITDVAKSIDGKKQSKGGPERQARQMFLLLK